MNPLYAHSKKNAPQSEWQTLDSHSAAVAALASVFAAPFGAAEWSFAMGLLHDLGKKRLPFQDMLAGKRVKSDETHHAKYGAAAAYAKNSLPLTFAIAGHHAGLPNLFDLQAVMIDVNALELSPSISFPPETSLPVPVAEDNTLPLEVFTRMLFSCLIDADRLDAAFWEKMGKDTIRLSTPYLPLNAIALLENVLVERDRKRAANPDSLLADTRNRIFDACLAAGEKPRGFFSLTVPTGGGKTLAGIAFALAHAKRHNLRRVIVVIPYLSIIEQNAAEYRRVLDPQKRGVVLECHSSVKPRDNTVEEENSRLELLSENWDAPIIVTTSVQFIESLFAASPSRTRKLHNICESVVIFDEVQALPAHLLTPTLSVFRELTAHYGVSFMFSSATQPAFRQSKSLLDGFKPGEITEIAPEPSRLFAELRRVNYRLPESGTTLNWDALADNLAAVPQCLCVVNLTRHAFELWKKLNDRITDSCQKPFHLSSAMCPAHRLAVIRRIRRLLKAGLPCRVVSTQLIEAGVDVDFPAVWRAMGPLDSIVQVAGRCNREGKLKDETGKPRLGDVCVFIPEDNVLPRGLYSTATGQAATTLAGLGDAAPECLANNPDLFTRYFTALFQLTSLDKDNIQNDRNEFRFRKVAEKAVVIQDSGTPVIIPIGRARHLLLQIRNRTPNAGEPRFTRDDLRRLQRYMVNVRVPDFNFYKLHGLLSPLLPNMELFVLDTAQYNRHLGVLKPDGAPPLEDFLS